jgi:hypothetical protein
MEVSQRGDRQRGSQWRRCGRMPLHPVVADKDASERVDRHKLSAVFLKSFDCMVCVYVILHQPVVATAASNNPCVELLFQSPIIRTASFRTSSRPDVFRHPSSAGYRNPDAVSSDPA